MEITAVLAGFIHHDRPRLMQGPGIATFRVCFVSGLQMTLPMYKTAIGEDRDMVSWESATFSCTVARHRASLLSEDRKTQTVAPQHDPQATGQFRAKVVLVVHGVGIGVRFDLAVLASQIPFFARATGLGKESPQMSFRLTWLQCPTCALVL